jgi:hypothetical protein
MKRLVGTDIVGGYIFDPAAKTVTFTGLQYTITLANILLITNTTANTIIYNFADSTNGAVSFASNVLTLDHNTVSMGAADALQIYIDVESYDESMATLLRRMNKLLESNAVVDSKLRQRVTIEAIGSNNSSNSTEINTTIPVTAAVSNQIASQNMAAQSANPYVLSTVTTASILEGPVHQLWRVANDAQACYASAIRSKLSFT